MDLHTGDIVFYEYGESYGIAEFSQEPERDENGEWYMENFFQDLWNDIGGLEGITWYDQKDSGIRYIDRFNGNNFNLEEYLIYLKKKYPEDFI